MPKRYSFIHGDDDCDCDKLPLTQIILKVPIFVVHYDLVDRNSLLVAGLNFAIVLAQHDCPQSWQR